MVFSLKSKEIFPLLEFSKWVSPPVITNIKSCASKMKCHFLPTFPHSELKWNFATSYNAARCVAKHTKIPDVHYLCLLSLRYIAINCFPHQLLEKIMG